MIPISPAFQQEVVKGNRSSTAQVLFGVYDVTAREDATPSASSSQPFTSINAITADVREPQYKVATFEDDYFKLDGSFNLMPDDINPVQDLVGWWSKDQSDEGGNFQTTALTFVRASQAVRSDGTTVANNVPRYEAGKFGNGIMIEEGTTNIFPIEKSVVIAGGSGTHNFGVTSGIVQGGTYTLSAFITAETNDGTVNSRMTLRLYYSDGTNDSFSTVAFPKDGIERRYRITGTANSSKTLSNVGGWILDHSNAGTGKYQSARNIQLERKAFATSFTDGTRAGESLDVSPLGIINPTSWTIEFWANVSQVTGGWQTFARLYDSASGHHMYLDYLLSGNGTVRFVYRNTVTGTNSTLDIPKSVVNTTIGWHYFAIRCDILTKDIALTVDNVTVRQTWADLPAIDLNVQKVLRFGGTGTSEHINGVIDDIRISSVFRSDAEILTAYQSNKPLPIDEYTTCKMNFDGSIVATTPTITVSFTSPHSSYGLGVMFGYNDYCTDFEVTWYNGVTQLAYKRISGNTNKECNIDYPVENYNKIVIRFLRTNNPYRYVRLMELAFGLEEVFDNSDLISANIIEEVDPSSGTLSINTLRFTVLNRNQRFNMLNPEGVYAYLQQRQKIVARSGLLVDDQYEYVPMGTYYLNDWENATGLTASLYATDLIGLLDRTQYKSSPFWVNEPVENVLRHILNDAGQFQLSISIPAGLETITGYIPIKSHREAIQDVLIASTNVARVSRSNYLDVTKASYSPVANIDYTTMLGSPSIKQKPMITSVEVNELSYTLSSTASEIYKSDFTISGTQTVLIDFGKAVSGATVSVTGGSIIGTPKISAVSAEVTVSGAGSVTITVNGKEYIETARNVSASISIPAGQVPQTATVGDNKLVKNGTAVANNLLNYFQKRIKQSFKYSANPAIQAGDCVDVETVYGVDFSGIVEHQEVTFSPYLRASMEVTG